MKPPRLLITATLLLALPAQAVRTNELVGSFKIAAELARRSSQELAVTQAAAIITTYIASAVDPDGDPFPEPPPFLTGAGPAGGGLVPTLPGLGAPISDGYGGKLGYCAWDNGAARVSTGRLPGNASDTGAITFAVVSAGLDGVFNRSCAQIASGAVFTDDDFVVTKNTEQIRQGVGGTVYFGDPVADVTALGLLTSGIKDGELRLMKSNNTLWRWNAGTWEPVANTYAANNVAVTGGTINGTAIGNTTPSSGAFTTLSGTLTGNVTGNLTGNVIGNVTGNVSGNVSGNAGTASKLFTPRSLSISGDATWSAVFDGSTDVSSALTLANSGVTAGIYGSSVSVPTFTVDAKGRLTYAANLAITPTLSSLTGAAATNTLSNGINAQYWNWQLAGNGSAFSIGETAASTGGSGTQYLMNIATRAGSTAVPLAVFSRGVEAMRIDAVNPQIVANAGSANAPSYAFAGDQSTGLYSPAAGQLAASVTGTRSLWISTGSFNTALGQDALKVNSIGIANNAFGSAALSSNTMGSDNTAIGDNALYNNVGGGGNTAVGGYALRTASGSRNTALGRFSGYTATNPITTADSTFLGYSASIADNATTAGSGAITLLGANTSASLGVATPTAFMTAIGSGASVTTINTVVLGRAADATVIGATGDDGTGATNKLQVTGGIKSTGTVTAPTFAGALTGNASTATALQTARAINGVSFDGTAAITIPANTTFSLTAGSYLTGSAFNGSAAVSWAVNALSTNTASTVVARDASGNFAGGTITATTFSGALTGNVTGNLTGNVTGNLLGNVTGNVAGALTGNASTATALQNARAINGVSFDGTAAITIPTAFSLTAGNYLTGSAFNGSAAVSWAVNALSTNTASTVVARDASGNFAGGTITANTFSGSGSSLTGIPAATAITGTLGVANGGTGTTTSTGTGSVVLHTNPTFAGNVTAPSFAATSFSGTLLGNASTATAVTTAVDAGFTPRYLTFVNSSSGGAQSLGFGSLLTYTPNTNTLSAGNVTLTGKLTTAAGTEAAPSHTFSGDTATGLYLPTAGQLAGSASGNRSLWVTAGSVALGKDALKAETITTKFNTAIGARAMIANTAGGESVAVGHNALASNVGGDFNTAVGSSAMQANDYGKGNVATGYVALNDNTSGDYNVAIGFQALRKLTTGTRNTAIGQGAGETTNNPSTNSYSTFIGNSARPDDDADITSGSGYITLLGASTSAGLLVKDPTAYMTAIGAGARVTTINTIALGRASVNDKIVIGTTADDLSGNKLQVTGGIKATGSVVAGGVTLTSDIRLKENIQTLDRSDVLQRLKSLNGYRYNFIADPDKKKNYGVIAQEVLGLFPDAVRIIDAQGHYGVDYSALGAMAATGVGQLAVDLDKFGTGVDRRTATNGSLLIGNGAGYTLATLTADNGISITNSAGGIRIKNTGVTTFNGRTGPVTLTPTDVAGITEFGDGNFTLGTGALALTATGSFNTASGQKALASTGSGSGNTAFGYQALAGNVSGDNNVSVGRWAGYADSSGNASNAILTGANNTFIGAFARPGTKAQLNYATAIGADALVTTIDTIVLGRVSDVTVLGATGDDHSGNRLQVTGGIKATGNLTARALSLSAGTSTKNGLWIENGAAAGAGNALVQADDSTLLFSKGQIDGAAALVIAPWANGSSGLRIAASGVSVAGSLAVSGTVSATSAFAVSSDVRYKKNITPVINALATIDALQGVHYEFDRAAFPKKGFEAGRQLGFIAQQIEQFVPEVVRTDAEGYKSVQYSQLVPLLAEGIKAQQLVLQHLIKKDPATLLVDIKTFQGNDAVFENIKSTNIKTANLDADIARIKKLEADRIDTKYLRSDVMKTGETEVFVSLGSFQPIFVPLADAQYIVNATAEDGSSAFASVAFMAGKITVTPISGKGVDVTTMGTQVGLVAASKKVKATWIRMS